MSRAAGALALVLAIAALARSIDAQDAAGPSLALAGDIIHDAPTRYGVEHLHAPEAEGYAHLWDDAGPVLAAADLAFANLETPIAERTRSRDAEHDAPTFAAPTSFLASIAGAGIDVLSVANNHAYDQGAVGLASTLDAGRALGLSLVGAGADRDAAARASIVTVRGVRVAFVAFTEGTNRRLESGEPDTPRVAFLEDGTLERAIIDARARSELTIVSLHWTIAPDDDLPTRTMRGWAQRVVDAGADLVVGHGPHVPARMERLVDRGGRSVPVLFSLGNLHAIMEADDDEVRERVPSVRDALVARVSTRRVGRRFEVASVAAEPFWISAPRRSLSEGPWVPLTRPRSIPRELSRLARAACGRDCDRLADAYRQRAALADTLLTGEQRSPPREPEPVAEPPRQRATALVSAEPHAVERRTAPERAPERDPRPEPERAPEPERTVVHELVLSIEFPLGAMQESRVDDAQIRDLGVRMQADRALRAEFRVDGCERSLALRRARRASGLVAIRGPSRSRFDLVAGDASAPARVRVRLVR